MISEINYRYFNNNKFKNDLKAIPWENILTCQQV